jgi:hypothetical protein
MIIIAHDRIPDIDFFFKLRQREGIHTLNNFGNLICALFYINNTLNKIITRTEILNQPSRV